MKSKARVLSLMMALAIVVSAAFTGCGKSEEVATSTTPETTVATDTNSATTTGVTHDTSEAVVLKGYLLGAPQIAHDEVISALNEKLSKDINAKIEANYIAWGDLTAKYPLILAAGEDVDWIYTASWCQYPTEAAKGAFMEITEDMLAKNMPLHTARIKDTTAFSETLVNGKSYMITTTAPDKILSLALYREDLRKKYNVPEIKKWADIEPYLEAIKANEKDMIPMNLDQNYDIGVPGWNMFTTNYQTALEIVIGSGIYYNPFDPTGALVSYDDPTFLEERTKAAKTAKAWYDKGYINKNVFNNKTRSKESFVEGKSAIGFGNSTDSQGNIASATAKGWEVGILPILDGKNGKATLGTYNGNGFAIPAKSPNSERTLMAMDLIMNDKDYSHLIYYGIEGKNYIIKDGKVDLPEGITADTNTYPADAAGWWFINRDAFEPNASWTTSYIALRDKINNMEFHTTNVLAQFVPITDSFTTELANCTNVGTQYGLPVAAGAVKDVDAAHRILAEKYKAAGQDTIKAEITKQVQAYLASKK